ncbi:unnamed protein product [Brassica oleracea]
MVVIVVITSSAPELKEWKRHMVQSRLDAPHDLHLPLLPLQALFSKLQQLATIAG